VETLHGVLGHFWLIVWVILGHYHIASIPGVQRNEMGYDTHVQIASTTDHITSERIDKNSITKQKLDIQMPSLINVNGCLPLSISCCTSTSRTHPANSGIAPRQGGKVIHSLAGHVNSPEPTSLLSRSEKLQFKPIHDNHRRPPLAYLDQKKSK